MFQKSILDKYLSSLNEIEVSQAFSNLSDFKSSIKNIKEAKEEQYQSGFLNDFFVKALGYTLFPKDNYNLTTEFKNQSDSKKADGAILKDGKPVAVIELKSTKTKSMEKIVNQAFVYKNNHPTCKYIITSNFEKLRLYIEHSNEYIEFNLFKLTFEDFKIIYLLLSRDNLFVDLPKRVKDESKLNQDSIAKEFYKKYSNIRVNLFGSIINSNQIEKEIALMLSQKILDRFIFIFFAEDKYIIDNKITESLINQYRSDWEKRELYHFVKILFKAINEGNDRLNISAYNGGLFRDDEKLNSLKIEDSILLEILELSHYDFDSEVDVNILGHIFENSLDDLERIKESDYKSAQRKKDGIFYTPNYITDYIVKNTIGTICENKKVELNIDNFDINKKLSKDDIDNFNDYKTFLINLKILDPACGSGAFLNQAFNYLLKEYQFTFDVLNKYAMQKQDLFLFEEIDILILENNLFGVDINEEAIEIAKLSLWLKTAKRGRKLTNLNSNIKVGNSLIDDKEIDSKAFDWREEFKEVFNNGGFDVVIGNPPYGANFSKLHKDNLKETYKEIYKGKYDSYHFFTQKGLQLLNKNGFLGYIIPDTWTILQQTEKLRKFILDYSIYSIEKYNYNIFEDANVDTVTIIIQNKTIENNEIKVNIVDKDLIKRELKLLQNQFLKNDGYVFNYLINNTSLTLLNKIKEDSLKIKDFCEWSQGLIPYDKYVGMSKETIKNRIYHSSFQKDETYKKELAGKDISKYNLKWNGTQWISYGTWLASPRKQKFFTEPRILIQRIRNPKLKIRIVATYTEEEYYNNPALSNFILLKNSNISLKYILVILNSKMINWLYRNSFTDVNIKPTDLELLPIKYINETKQKPFIEKADLMLKLNEEFANIKNEFLNELQTHYNLEKLSKKLDNFYTLNFDDFLKEITKVAKLKLTTAKEKKEIKNYWSELFEEKSQKLIELKEKIDNTDREIDEMVYKLYGLNEEEIKVIQESLK